MYSDTINFVRSKKCYCGDVYTGCSYVSCSISGVGAVSWVAEGATTNTHACSGDCGSVQYVSGCKGSLSGSTAHDNTRSHAKRSILTTYTASPYPAKLPAAHPTTPSTAQPPQLISLTPCAPPCRLPELPHAWPQPPSQSSQSPSCHRATSPLLMTNET